MAAKRKYPRRNGDKDLSELVRIFEKLEFEDFMTLFEIFENYRDKTSSLRIIRLLYDALTIGRIRQVKALAPILESEANWAKSAASDIKPTRKRTENEKAIIAVGLAGSKM